MRLGLLAVVGMAGAGSAACGGLSTSAEVELVGRVLRGPITPVCVEGQPCDAPFSANFLVFRGGRLVTGFQSAADGRFRLTLAPGLYLIRPRADAPLLSPEAQSREVRVEAQPVTEVELHFDTGIR